MVITHLLTGMILQAPTQLEKKYVLDLYTPQPNGKQPIFIYIYHLYVGYNPYTKHLLISHLLTGMILQVYLINSKYIGVLIHLLTFYQFYQGIVGCTPTNVPLWEIPI